MATKTIKIYALIENNTTNNYVQMQKEDGSNSWQTGLTATECWTAKYQKLRTTFLKSDFSNYLDKITSVELVFEGLPSNDHASQAIVGYMTDQKRTPNNSINSTYLIYSFNFSNSFHASATLDTVHYTFSDITNFKNWINSNTSEYSYLVLHAPNDTSPSIYFRNCYFILTYEEAEATTPVSSITLNPTSLTLTIGKTATINATVFPDNATNKELSWSSDKTSVATVDSNGKVTAISAGSAIITCAAKDGSGISTNCNVTIQSQINDALQSAIIKQYPTELYVEETYQLELILNPTNANIKAIEWTSSDKSIATISNTGLVTALYNLNLKSKKELTFTCLITDIYDNSIEVSCSFYIVQKYVTVISLNPETIEITVGEEITISASIFPISAINKTITWFYNNTVLEKISEDSSTITLKGIKVGESSIICSANDQSGLISTEGSISVVEINIPVTNIELEPTEVTLELGQSQTFSISIFPENATNKDIEWRSPNTDFYDYISLLNNTITVIKADENIDKTFILYVYSKSNSNISKSCIITVSGIKTYNAYIFIEGEYRPAKAYIYNGGWQECSSIYIYNNGWKQTTII